MIIPQNIFREYDIRGIAETELAPEFCVALGKAYGTYIQHISGSKKVLVGHDNRLSSERINQNIVEGLAATGCEVLDLGLTLSPIAYFARVKLGIDGLVMITASHNPKEFNGFKLAHNHGTIFGEEIQKIRTMIEAQDFISGSGKVENYDIFPEYLSMLKEKIQLKLPLKIVVDCGNGTASTFAQKILAEFGIAIIPLNCDSNGNFPKHNPDPVKIANLKELLEKVKTENAVLGIGIDGDGDRLGVVDEKGNILWGDQLMSLFAREVLAKNPGAKIIVEVKSSQALLEDIAAHNGQPILWKTGHSLIEAKMKEEGALLAGEVSGHMYFADEYFGFDDALYASLRLLRIVSQSGKTLSELFADIPKYFATPEIRIAVSDERKFVIVAEISARLKEKYQVVDIDGARVLFPEGWALVRASNTQPAIIIRAEGKTPEALEKIKQEFGRYFLEYPEIHLDWEEQGV